MDWKQLGSDFKQKYEHCFCNITLEGRTKPELFYLEQVDVNVKESPFLCFTNNRVGSVILRYDDSKSDLDFSFPPIGLISVDGQVFMVRRRHERQWKSGVCANTIDCFDIYSRIDSHGILLHRVSLDFPLVAAMYSPRPARSLRTAVSLLSKHVAMPLSSEFAVGLPLTSSEEFILFYYENPIGTVNPSTEKVVLKELQFIQEFEDFKHLGGLGRYEAY